MRNYTSSDWYWQGTPAGYTSSIIYSSASSALVTSIPSTWLQRYSPTPWPRDETGAVTTAALDEVLASQNLPVTGLTPLTKTQLLAMANQKVQTLLATPRPYTVTGLSGPVVDDVSGQSYVDMSAAYAQLSSLTYPFAWSDDDFTVWEMTQAELTQFLMMAFAYGNSVWAFMNGTMIPGINAGSITTAAQVAGAAWPT